MIYSLYIYDRHCECVFYQDWHRVSTIRPGKSVLPDVIPSIPSTPAVPPPTEKPALNRFSTTSMMASLPGQLGLTTPESEKKELVPASKIRKSLPFDEEAKLVYGVLFSLRNLVKKLAARESETFLAYKTSVYKFHYYETMTGFKFILLTDQNSESMRFVLRQIYTNAFLEFVVRNPLSEVDSRISGKGIGNEAFRAAVNGFITSLSVYST